MTRTALYRHFDAAGALLYVGISLSAVQRMAQHKNTSAWFAQIARVDVEWHSSREAAEAAERAAIHAENPRCNSVRYGAAPKQAQPPAVQRETLAVCHLRTGRLDGWYCRRSVAEHMLGWFRATFPQDRFELVAPRTGLESDNYIHKHRELKHFDHALWAAGPPDHAAGSAFDQEAA